MNGKRIEARIRAVCDVPVPEGKDAFLRELRDRCGHRNVSPWRFVLTQSRYIRKRVWLVSAFALAIALLKIRAAGLETIALVCAVMPFVSGLSVWESLRSRLYGMDEMEGATRFSLRGILLARTAAVGLVHVLLLLCATLLLAGSAGYGYAMTGALITIPYLLSSVLGMEAERTEWGRKSALPGMGISALTSLGVLLLQGMDRLYIPDYRGWWIAGALLLLLIHGLERKRLFENGGYTWN